MIRVLSVVGVLLTLLSPLAAAEKEPQKDPQAAARAAIDAVVEAYAAAFNKHDAKALAALWSPSGVHVDRETGRRTTGRAALEKMFAAQFAEDEGQQIEIAVDTVRLVTPDVAAVEGSASVSMQDEEEPSESTFSAIFVKQDGKWLLDSANETNLPPPPKPYEHLKDLEWLVGAWQDESDEIDVKTVCRWTPNRSFLIRTYTVTDGDGATHQGAQIIGWDPDKECIRCWIFGSEGGFGEGTVARDGNRWLMKLHGTLADGRKACATQVLTKVDDNTLTAQMVGREIGGELLPSTDPVKVVRVPDAK
jgi:uncharacterized protein (TIGR02246 family)